MTIAVHEMVVVDRETGINVKVADDDSERLLQLSVFLHAWKFLTQRHRWRRAHAMAHWKRAAVLQALQYEVTWEVNPMTILSHRQTAFHVSLFAGLSETRVPYEMVPKIIITSKIIKQPIRGSGYPTLQTLRIECNRKTF